MKRVIKAVVATLGFFAVTVVIAFVYFFIVAPRRVLARYERFVAVHGVGTSIDDLASDAFVERATMITLDAQVLVDFGMQPSAKALPTRLLGKRGGELMVMWTHTPPFGRVSVNVTFDDGKIVALHKDFLD
jgi:hypothetical protein